CQRLGGLGGAIAEALAVNAPTPMILHGLQDVFGESGPDGALLDKYGISAEKTAAAIRDAVANR
ncbi:MAG: transketolase family protein, partial [Acidimicrobiia bacterium]|nr:transketolase family protein [Acidimicrobiia bacterium]